jgi:hypothetical protein
MENKSSSIIIMDKISNYHFKRFEVKCIGFVFVDAWKDNLLAVSVVIQ